MLVARKEARGWYLNYCQREVCACQEGPVVRIFGTLFRLSGFRVKWETLVVACGS